MKNVNLFFKILFSRRLFKTKWLRVPRYKIRFHAVLSRHPKVVIHRNFWKKKNYTARKYLLHSRKLIYIFGNSVEGHGQNTKKNSKRFRRRKKKYYTSGIHSKESWIAKPDSFSGKLRKLNQEMCIAEIPLEIGAYN